MNEIKLSELKTSDTISNLVPEMSEKEYLDLKSSIEESGLRHPVDINKDNTILDGRHRVRVYEALGYESIPFTRHDLSESEAIKFVVDTAVNRRNLTEAQRLNIVLNSEDVITEIVERAKERQKESIKAAHKKNPNHSDNRLGSTEPNLSNLTPTNTNEEIGKLAGVSRATVNRAKKVRRENPEAYQKVVNGESSWSKEFDNLPSVKESRAKRSTEKESPNKKTKPSKEDLRDVINNQSKDFTDSDKKLMRAESQALNIVESSRQLNEQIKEIEDMDLFIRFASTLEIHHIEDVFNSLEKIINQKEF